MSPSRSTRVPSVLPKAAKTVLLLLALATAGCSSTPRSHQASWSAAGGPVDPQQAAVVEARRTPEVEDDGIEPQVAPPPSIRLAPDDPSEPWSPNYGKRPADLPGPAAAPSPAVKPAGPPPSPRPTTRPRFASVHE